LKPDLFKNYLLRNISPLDPEYDLSDLINDFYEMSKSSKKSAVDHEENIKQVLAAYGRNEDELSMENTDSMSVKEQHFRKCIDDEIFKPRRLALQAIKEGIQLEGVFIVELPVALFVVKHCLTPISCSLSCVLGQALYLASSAFR
jgi:hypothetical protein